jgi:hypothetical protein
MKTAAKIDNVKRLLCYFGSHFGRSLKRHHSYFALSFAKVFGTLMFHFTGSLLRRQNMASSVRVKIELLIFRIKKKIGETGPSVTHIQMEINYACRIYT